METVLQHQILVVCSPIWINQFAVNSQRETKDTCKLYICTTRRKSYEGCVVHQASASKVQIFPPPSVAKPHPPASTSTHHKTSPAPPAAAAETNRSPETSSLESALAIPSFPAVFHLGSSSPVLAPVFDLPLPSVGERQGCRSAEVDLVGIFCFLSLCDAILVSRIPRNEERTFQ